MDSRLRANDVARIRRKLGHELRRIRIDSGVSAAEIAERMQLSRSMLSKLEHGQAGTSIKNIERLAQILKVDEDTRTLLLNYTRALRGVDPASREPDLTSRSVLRWAPLFETALKVRVHVQLIPALVQTPAHARAIMAGIGQLSEEPLLQQARARCQAGLWDPQKQFEFVVYEHALRQSSTPLDAASWSAQLLHLLLVVELPNVELRVIDFDNFHTVTDFTIFDDSQVLIDLVNEQILIQDPDEVRHYRDFFEKTRDRAKSPKESVAILHKRLREAATVITLPSESDESVPT